MHLLGRGPGGYTASLHAEATRRFRWVSSAWPMGQVASKPAVLFTDRGRGFYQTNSGTITPDWKQGVDENGFRTFMGDNAVRQPGSLQDIVLHETAVSWLRRRLERSTPKKCWEETREAYGSRLKRCCEEVNKECDVEGLCNGFPKRIKLLEENGGDRLPH